MMPLHRPLFLLLCVVGLIGCQTAVITATLPTATIAPTTVAPTAVPTTLPTHIPTAVPITTPIPTATHTPPATTTPQPTSTPIPTATHTATNTPWPTPTAVGTPIDRRCPNPAPLKPIYDRYYLPFDRWPRPNPELAQPHFWLGHPFPGGDRLLINQDFPYGWDNNGRLLLHNGIDTAEPLGTPLLAVADGTIIVAQSDEQERYGWRCNWYGHLVILQLDQTWDDQPIYILYGHVLNITVEPGQRVRQGEQVAAVGFGGAATAPHLHLEIRVGSNEFSSTRNPMLWFPPSSRRGLIVGRLIDPDSHPWQGVDINLIPSDGNSSNSRRTWSYLGDPDSLANPDEGYAENFLFADVRPGSYELLVNLQGVEYKSEVVVNGGEITAVEIITKPLKETDQ